SPQGPRSLIRTRTTAPVSGRRTSTHVPKGKLRCAAVIPRGSKRSPFDVRLPANDCPYHVASPTWYGAGNTLPPIPSVGPAIGAIGGGGSTWYGRSARS